MNLVASRRTNHALRALIELCHAARPAKAREMALELRIPVAALQHVLGDLVRSGLVTSRPSGTGGYHLAAPAEAITVLDIVQAVEGPIAESSRCVLTGEPCDTARPCPVHELWTRAREAMAAELSRATLANVAGTAGGPPAGSATR